MRGDGSLRVEDGHVFAIPILGPLSEIINKIIPGAGFQTARLATADFTVGDERINTKNLKVEGAGFSLLRIRRYLLCRGQDEHVRAHQCSRDSRTGPLPCEQAFRVCLHRLGIQTRVAAEDHSPVRQRGS